MKHDNPFLSSVGSGTVVADGLSFLNADYSNTSFRVSRVAIGAHNFLGNHIAYPAQGRTGDNCLLATKVMVPMDGPVREGVGLLGSPSFEIPRTVERDSRLDVQSPHELRRGLAAKNRHNVVTIALLLLSRWVLTVVLTVLALATAGPLLRARGAGGRRWPACWPCCSPSSTSCCSTGRCAGCRRCRPPGCSIYDRGFWRHERFWKVCADTYAQAIQRHPVQERGLADAGRAGRPPGLRRRLLS